MRTVPLIISAAAVSLAGATDAQQSGQQIVVTGEQITPQKWSKRVTGQLNRAIRYPRPYYGHMADTGLVKVRFECGETGLPAAVALSETSGRRSLDREALRAVSRIKTLHPMPEAYGADQRFEAHIFFASSEDNLKRQIARAARGDAARRQVARHDKPTVVLNAGLLAPDRVG